MDILLGVVALYAFFGLLTIIGHWTEMMGSTWREYAVVFALWPVMAAVWCIATYVEYRDNQ